MIVNLADRGLVTWAVEHGTPVYYTQEQGLPNPCLKIHFGHVTAYFCKGQLTRLWAHADRAYLDEMFEQLMKIFELCGCCRSLVQFDEAKLYWKERVGMSKPSSPESL